MSIGNTFLICAALCGLISSCNYNVQQTPNLSTPRVLATDQSGKPKRLQIYFDGTSNDWLARTNVRRRFELTAAAEDPFHPCLYVEGVGVSTFSGKVLGTGIKRRVLQGYCFLARHWSQKNCDEIDLYGFSRGAFQARVLAGLLAHCGLPDAHQSEMSDAQLEKLASEVWTFSEKELKDLLGNGKSAGEWHTHLESNRQLTRQRFPNLTFQNPKIRFMGLWDTVPGLPFTQMDELNNPRPDKDQLYKIRPYPNVGLILHALALNDVRSRFMPLLVGPPLDPSTKVHEVWFPGAHSDVGGGYDKDSNDLAGVSLAWMHQLMISEKLTTRTQGFFSDSHGLLHHPENNIAMKLINEQKRRILPRGSVVDLSVFKRANAKPHPEEGGPKEGVVYEPMLAVLAPGEDASSTDRVKTETLQLKGPYTPEQAKAALESIGLKLYEPGSLRTQSTGKTPLEVSDMKVLLQTVDDPAPPPSR